MIYFTTFIFALLLSHIACATPTCDDVFSPDDAIMYADAQQGQHALHKPPVTNAPPKAPPPFLFSVTWAPKYSIRNISTKSATCSSLAPQYPHFGNFPHFPYIGGAWNITSSSSKACGKCVNLTDLKTHRTIFITVMDKTKHALPGWYNTSEEAFRELNGGKPGIVLQAEAKEVNARYCHPIKK